MCFDDIYVGMQVKYTGEHLDLHTVGVVIQKEDSAKRILVKFPDESYGKNLRGGACLHTGYGLDPTCRSLYFSFYLAEYDIDDLKPLYEVNKEVINLEEE